jgi:7,8-dihydropterin-6-yl-methyl-4-(beta-D-ribofuranosyl)aminobenzene 5'-phosphate synthase
LLRNDNNFKNLGVKLRASIVFDNTTTREDLIADWGFSCYIEAYGKKILFDTGSNGEILLNNMKNLNIIPEKIDEIFISHNHFDHIGGLSAFLNKNNMVKIYVPRSLRGIRNAREVVSIERAEELENNIFTSGELAQIEQSLAIKVEKGIVLFVGCSHPPMEKILDTVSQFGNIFAIVGGLHGFNQLELFQQMELICPTHCTQKIFEIKNRYPQQCIEGGVGTVINF